MKNIRFIKSKSGTIKTIDHRVYLPRSEFHCRFPSLFEMNDPARWTTYHRSDYKKFEGTTKKQFKFQGNQDAVKNGMYPKTGNFYNPFRFKKYRDALTPVKKTLPATDPAFWYDRLLEHQKDMAAYVVSQVQKRDPEFKINSDNNYTCVLFSLPKPKNEKNPSIWNEFLSVYLIALTNKLAHERGINIEMVHRSSFGTLRPSVSDCVHSVRVNLGLSPIPYAQCVVDAIFYLQRIIDRKKDFEIPLISASLTKTLAAYNKISSTKTKQVSIQIQKTLWDTLWAPGDKSNKSFASQIFRRSYVKKEHFVDLIMDGCSKMPLEKVFKNTKAFKNAFVTPVEKILKLIKVKGKSISMQADPDCLKSFSWGAAKPVKDNEFWELVNELAECLGATQAQINALINKKTTEDLHSRFEALVADFVFKPFADSSVEEGCGSESEEEGELEIEGEAQQFYAKKMITATGMRAIQLIHATAKNFLHTQYGIDPLYISFTANQMYYETSDALGKHPIPIDLHSRKKNKKFKRTIAFFDVNHCNTKQVEMEDMLDLINTNARICAIDVTSATTTEIRDTLVRLYEQRSRLEVVLAISSGLKNEQAMGDYNPYGTVRIFAKSKESLDVIYDDLVQLEEQAEYLHPRESHLLRKSAKLAGMTPTNAAILGGPTI